MSSNRKSIPSNVARKLWAQSAGYCQNPACNRELFADIDECTSVSLANVAHIIGHGSNGPRSDHELAEFVERDGFDNLIMLCLDCHKVVDELEETFSVEELLAWKEGHALRIRRNFKLPRFSSEKELLIEIDSLLEENGEIFRSYGPFSENVIKGLGGDSLTIWRRRCLDTIIPNNQRIIDLVESHKGKFGYPWDLYRKTLIYKMHADAFRENCILGVKVNDYKLFPAEYPHFVKTSLGLPSEAPELREDEELEYRNNQVRNLLGRFLYGHSRIKSAEELHRGGMLITLDDDRELKVFVTNTYCFTVYTLDRVLEVDPAVDAIICSSPAGSYSEEAKVACIERGIGLFGLGEFMGAISAKGEEFLNYLLKSQSAARLTYLKRIVEEAGVDSNHRVYAFGSYLRRQIFNDVDLIIVAKPKAAVDSAKRLERSIATALSKAGHTADITVCSEAEFSALKLRHDNVQLVR